MKKLWIILCCVAVFLTSCGHKMNVTIVPLIEDDIMNEIMDEDGYRIRLRYRNNNRNIIMGLKKYEFGKCKKNAFLGGYIVTQTEPIDLLLTIGDDIITYKTEGYTEIGPTTVNLDTRYKLYQYEDDEIACVLAEAGLFDYDALTQEEFESIEKCYCYTVTLEVEE